MPNGILRSNNINPINNIKQHISNNYHHDDNYYASATTLKRPVDKNTNGSDDSKQIDTQSHKQQPEHSSTILNVAEMLLHGVADHEILDIWLTSISCQEFVKNFLDSGYDMPTISRVTPQDLTAIGITDPTKRSKIISEIKKLNLQDGIPNFRPASLSHWLALLRLDSNYYKSLCDQKMDTIDKVCQLTWEDLEELGIAKLGHQKRLLIAIDRLKELDIAESKASTKPISEPIYDTNSSQILLVASSENHSMNGPIINKQSSTSELSSTGSGSMHSIYSASSHNQQPTSNAVQQANSINNNNNNNNGIYDTNLRQQQQSLQSQQQQQPQAIYSQLPSPHFQQQQQIQANQMLQSQTTLPKPPPLPPFNLIKHNDANATPVHHRPLPSTQRFSHYQTMTPTQFTNFSIYGNSNDLGNHLVPEQQQQPQQNYQVNRQSLGQLPFAALANLPKHQQQLLQQSSIYATLTRQPQRAKQPPPPVPIRTNSLKSNSLIDEEDNRQRNEQLLRNSINSSPLSQQQQQNQTIYGDCSNSTASVNSLLRNNSRMTNRNQSNTQLHKNKSFSGNAYMDAARARFLNRNNSQQQLQQQLYAATSNLTQHIRNLTNGANDIESSFNAKISNYNLTNATTGRDDDFPPPPSPLSMTDFDT